MDNLARSRGRRTTAGAIRVLLLVLAVLPHVSPAQAPPPPDAPGEAAKSPDEIFKLQQDVELVGVGQMRRWLEGARRDIARGSHIQATAELQKILDSEEDRTAQLSESPDAPHESLKFQALLLLGEHVRTGRTEYETQFGEMASDLLERAKQAGSAEMLGHVVRRFFHTQAGYEATFRLASNELDAGVWLDAALDFDRLRKCPWAARRFEPDLSLRTALAWHRAGYSAPAAEALAELKNSGVRDVHLDGRTVAIFPREDAAIGWLGDLFGPPPAPKGPTDWLMVGGDVRRTAVSSGSTPYLNQGWRRDAIERACEKPEQDDQVRRILEMATRQSDGLRHTLIPAAQPLVVGDVLFYRTLGGIRSLNSATGEQIDLVLDRDPMLKRLLDSNATAGNRNPFAALPNFVMSRAWRDQTYGTLSSNGTHLFAVEAAIPSADAVSMRVRGMPFVVANDNRLVSYDLDCRLIWEVGTPSSDTRDPYAGAYFMGPPLPVGNRLYGLVDFSGDLRLVCLRASDGRFEWSQSLWQAPPQTFLPIEPVRRSCGLSPSFAGGIFVCPTESGGVVAFDRTTRTLLWKFRYEVTSDNQTPNQQLMRRQRWMQQQQVPGNEPDLWIDGLALIVDDRVLVTPRDLNELVCLNLRTGAVHWRVPRGDGLFLSGVHNDRVIVVGQKCVTARRISDGQEAWESGPVPIATPSGRGFLSGDQLFLPLSKAVVSIDLVNGRKGAETPAREGRQLGNLVATPRSIVSQGIDFVDGYEQFRSLEATIAAALEKNPDDANALTLRAEVRLQRGEKEAAYADFQRALQLKPDDQRARTVLVEMLLEGLRTDFPNYRQKSSDLDSLITDVKTRSEYVRLLAQGLEQAGERLEALKAYLQLTGPQFEAAPPLEIEGATLGVSRLVRSRLLTLSEAASAEERAAMAAEVRRHWESLAGKNDVPALRQFLDNLEVPPGAGDAALVQVSDEVRNRLLDLLEKQGQWLEAELRLRAVSESGDAAVVGPALGRWAGLLAATSRSREALPVLSRLQTEFANVRVKGDQTGVVLAAEWLARPEMQAAADVEWPVVKPRAELQAIVSNYKSHRSSIVPVDGSRGEFIPEVTFEMDASFRDLTARDRHWQTLWKLTINPATVPSHPQVLRLEIVDHLLILSLGSQIVAIDVLGTKEAPGARVLWRYTIVEAARIDPRVAGRAPRGRRMGVVDSFGNPFGGLAAVTRGQVYVLKPTASGRASTLVALDSRTGSMAWSREVADGTLRVTADARHVFVLNDGGDTDIFRALDGSPVGQRDTLGRWQEVILVGGEAIVWNPNDGELARIDLLSNQKLWSHSVAARSWINVVENTDILVVEPEGRFAVVQAADGRRRIDNAEGLVAGTASLDWIVQASRDRYVLLPAVGPSLQLAERSVTARGVNPTLIVGTAHAFDRATGRRLWHRALEGHGMEVNQSAHLPIIQFFTMIVDRRPNPIPRDDKTVIACLDSRTGDMLFEKAVRDSALVPMLVTDPQALQITIRLDQSELVLDFTRPPDK